MNGSIPNEVDCCGEAINNHFKNVTWATTLFRQTQENFVIEELQSITQLQV